MADILLIAAEEDAERAFEVALELERRGWSVAWDGGRRSADPWTPADEAALAACGCCLVLWSRAARYSHGVGQAAAAAQRSGKLVGASLGRVTPPYGYPPPEAALDADGIGGLAPLLDVALRLGPGSYRYGIRARVNAQIGAQLRRLHGGLAGAVRAILRR